MADHEKEYDYETTPEIKQGHADVGKFNIGVEIILTVICILYLILHLKP